MIPGQGALPGLRLGDGNMVGLRELGELGCGVRVVHAATRDDERLLRPGDRVAAAAQLARAGAGPRR